MNVFVWSQYASIPTAVVHSIKTIDCLLFNITFCCCCLFSSLLHGKFYIFFVSSVLFVVNMCICPMSTLTKAGDLYASTHLRQLLLLLLLLLPILMKTEIFISIHFYFRSSKVISHRSICSKPFRLYSPKKR